MPEKFAGVGLEKKVVMGIINLSSETFYKNSLAESSEKAAFRAKDIVEKGAEIVDLGAMSTGPGVEPISVKEEKKTLLPTLEAVREEIDVPISVDTQRAEVAQRAIERGADIVNDISGLKADDEMPRLISDLDCSLIAMANRIKGRIRTAEKGRGDIQTMEEVIGALEESLKICKDNDIDQSRVAIDPGIGFGRDAEGDLRVISNLNKLSKLGRPICIGISRKSFIGKTLDIEDPSERLAGSLGATAIAVMDGADIVRTHDPEETVHLIRMIEAINKV